MSVSDGVHSLCGGPVFYGTPCGLSVWFRPTTVGAETASLIISNGSQVLTPPINLTGTGVASGGLTAALSATSLAFGNQTLNTNSAPQTVTITNPGPVPLNITGIAVNNGLQFNVTNTCGGNPIAVVAVGSSCTITVTFTPKATGAQPGLIFINDNATNTPQTISLTGTGVGSPSVTPDTCSSLAFANEAVGGTSGPQTVTIWNTGTATLNISGLSITGTSSADYAVRTSTCGGSVATGSSCMISVTFTPTATGTRTASISITDNATNAPQTISLTGTGVGTPGLSLSAISLIWNEAVGGTSGPQTVTVTNTGTATLNITGVTIAGANSADYALSTNTCGNPVAMGSNCMFSVTFKPGAAGVRTAQIIVADNAPTSPQIIGLSGTGMPSAVATLSATSLAFANEAVGLTGAPQTVTVTNTGTATLAISAIAISGTSSADFALRTSTCGNSLMAGSSCAISVTFTSTAAGTRTASISVTDNAANSPQTISLTGTVSANAAPTIFTNGVVPIYSTASTIQAGEWISIYGSNLAKGTTVWKGDFPASLGGTTVQINGKAGFISLASPGQINLQAPGDAATGTVPVVVTTAAGSATSTVTLVQFAPSFCLVDPRHVAGIILRLDHSGAYGGGTYDILGPGGNSLGYQTVAAKAGDIVELFGVGFGPTSPVVPAGQVYSGAAPTTNPVNVLINNVTVAPSFAGLSGAGLYQINLTIPPGVGTGDLSLAAIVGGVQTQSGVVIPVQ